MNEDRKWIDPLTQITDKGLPVIVLADDARSFIGWGIKHHTNGNYCHAMFMIRQGKAVSQNSLLREISLQQYMKPAVILKFWTYEPATREQRAAMILAAAEDVSKPWWKRGYDYLGILGQFTGLRWIQNSWKNYCSENVAKYLRLIPGLESLQKRPSPSDLNVFFNKTPGFKCLGYWWED